MFEFFEKVDKEIYREIVEEVEYNVSNSLCVSLIQSETEKILKNIYRESGVVITSKDNSGNLYYDNNPSVSQLLNNKEFVKFLVKNNILNEISIKEYWDIHKKANIKKHGARSGNEYIINDEVKKKSLKFLFDLCFNVYEYKFNESPKEKWNEKYFEKLIKKPEKNIETPSKNEIVESVDKKEEAIQETTPEKIEEISIIQENKAKTEDKSLENDVIVENKQETKVNSKKNEKVSPITRKPENAKELAIENNGNQLLGKSTLYVWSAVALVLFVLLQGLGIIYSSIVGASALLIPLSLGMVVVAIALIRSAMKEPIQNPTIKKLSGSIICLILALAITIMSLRQGTLSTRKE